jgi:TetR/AcrR family transcriptional regulator, lmrAB and yxaGH operons repressor
MASKSRERMIASAASLIGSRGANATSFTQVLADSGAPRGSVYYHFPAGKHQLVGDAVRWTKEQVLGYQRSCTADTPPGVVKHFVALFRQSLTSSQCRAGCPVAGVVLDSFAEEGRLRELVRQSFRSWVALLAAQFAATGMTRRRGRALAITTLAAVEGALILCRAEGNVESLDLTEGQLLALAESLARRST